MEIDFGTIGLKIGDEITFRGNKRKFLVSSGNGTPGNGGTLVRYPNGDLYSLRLITRKLMGDDFKEEMDIFELWICEGKTLRQIYRDKGY